MTDLDSQIRNSILTTMSGHKPTDDQVRALAAFLRTLSPPPPLGRFAEKPDKAACRAILSDTLGALAEQWPKIAQVMEQSQFDTTVNECVGLDGREIRKAVVTACASSKEHALDPNLLTIEDLLRSIRHTKKRKP